MAYSDFVVNIHTKVNHSNSTHASQSVILCTNKLWWKSTLTTTSREIVEENCLCTINV